MPVLTTNANFFLSVTVSSTATAIGALSGMNAAKLAVAERARITAQTNPLVYTYDGATAPTATVGHTLPKDTMPPVEILGNFNINNLQFIRQGAADGVLEITLETI